MADRIVVIGGGLGGVAVAVRLAAAGHAVTLLEQGTRLGGKMNRWESEGYRFDTGPSLITMPWVFAETFAAGGAKIEEHVELTRVDPLCEYVYDDGTRFTYTTALPEWLATVRNLDRADESGFLRFLGVGARIFELSRGTFFRREPSAPPDREALKAMRHMPLRHAWGRYDRAVAAHVRSPYLRQLLNRYPTYVGSSPYRSPATLSVIPFIEHAFGGWYAKGGLYSIVEALALLARSHGVEIRMEARVERIEQRGGRVTGVVLADGERIAATRVVMNGDASYARGMLDGGTSTPLPQPERSLSGVVLLLGLRRRLDGLGHHTILFSSDYDREFDQLFERGQFPDDPTVYVSATSRTDSTMAPPGGESLFVMANAPATDRPWEQSDIAAARGRMLARLRAGGIAIGEEDIVVEDMWTPSRIAGAYLMPGGAIYGTHSHGWRHAFLRPPNTDRKVKGLHYVGGSTHPGGGTPTVLMSASITAAAINGHR